MSRMLEALRALESRREGDVEPAAKANLVWPGPARLPVLTGAELAIDAIESPPSQQAAIARAPEKCALPTAEDLPDFYLELAGRITEQSVSYCNVVLFVSPDRSMEACFSLTHLAQAFALQSPGEVLLVDGDLRGGRLSKAVGCAKDPGMIEAMLGTAHWPDIIHATNTARIGFVSCGASDPPTVERPEFGWGALRPQYRVVLIGIAPAGLPETTWLAARCDGVYLLVSRPRTRRPTASAATNVLRSCGANVLGCIVAD